MSRKEVEEGRSRRCANVSLLYREHKHLMLAMSGIEGAGWGIFVKDAVSKGEYVFWDASVGARHSPRKRRSDVYH